MKLKSTILLLIIVLVLAIVGGLLFSLLSKRPPVPAPRPVVNSGSRQKHVLPAVIHDYYRLSDFYYSFDFSNINDEQFKPLLISKFESIFQSPLLDRMTDFARKGSLKSGYYTIFFELERHPHILSFFSSADDAHYVVNVEKELQLSYGLADEGCYDLRNMVHDYRITNVSQEQFDITLQQTLPAPDDADAADTGRGLSLKVNLTETFSLTGNATGAMLISNIQSTVNSSVLITGNATARPNE